MTQYEDDYDIDYTAPSSQAGGQKQSDQDMNLDPYDDLLDVDTLDDASWDEPMPAAQPRKAMKSGKAVKGGKKSSLFTPLLIGGAVLAGLGIIYFQFSGSSAPTTPSTMPAPLPTAEMPVDPNNPNAVNPNAIVDANGMPVPTDPAMAGQQPVPATGDLMALQQAQNDPNAMPQPAPTDAQQPAPAPTGGLLNDPNLLPPAGAPAPDATSPAPVMPTANDVQKAPVDPAAVANVETPPAPAPAIIPEPAPAAAPAPTPAPTAEAPKEAAPVVADTQPTPAPAPDTTTISNKELEDMRATIARLESKVKELESKPADVASTTTTTPSSSNLADEVAPAPKKKTTTKKKSSSNTSTKKKPSDAGYIAKAKTPAKSSSWELRGIAGGQAIVSKRGSEDFQSVGVGDNLSGVGTITSISNQNGAWVIEGTNGKIRQ